MTMQATLEFQPEIPKTIIRPCQRCEGPMLLMSVFFHTAALITKHYQSYICEESEIMTASMMVDPPGTAPGKPDCQPSRQPSGRPKIGGPTG